MYYVSFLVEIVLYYILQIVDQANQISLNLLNKLFVVKIEGIGICLQCQKMYYVSFLVEIVLYYILQIVDQANQISLNLLNKLFVVKIEGIGICLQCQKMYYVSFLVEIVLTIFCAALFCLQKLGFLFVIQKC
eukprot:TRINITY_DN33892_c0_g1_i2.p8 TRINITY_DN33892_c0_g1~~TRINITY_DN33892_c0_g1_i2.p8  ORF type:complete len:133 (-),score=12.65 TRINITY_DN33892_c0_g1_i2:6-404(-)